MQAAIGYLRVSSKEQGRSGSGLAAQRHDIETFGEREGFSIKCWHQDVQTGKGADALRLRPGLAAALKAAKAGKYPLIVSKLDRLSRNVHFISGLMEHRVHFIVAAFGMVCDNFVFHIYASLAEQERKLISERCRAAKLVAKRKGQKFYLQLVPKAEVRRPSALSLAVRRKAAVERAEAYRHHIEWALRQPGVFGRPISFTSAANRLNERNIESPMGRLWWGHQLQEMARRLGLNHPPAWLRPEIARARVRELWMQRPAVTAKEIMASMRLRFEHPTIGYCRVSKYLTECRRNAAKQSPFYKQMGWQLDRRTAARIRIRAIWKRQPDLTAKQVLAKLGPECPFRLRFVQIVMMGCARASAKQSPKQRLTGRRIFHSQRAGRGSRRPVR